LILDAAIESPMVLVAPAGGQNPAVRVFLQDLANDFEALIGRRQLVQAEFEEPLTRGRFSSGML
jgi:hypothetical protein